MIWGHEMCPAYWSLVKMTISRMFMVEKVLVWILVFSILIQHLWGHFNLAVVSVPWNLSFLVCHLVWPSWHKLWPNSLIIVSVS